MKKQLGTGLVALTLAFMAFTLGFFLGRNRERAPVTVQLPPAMQTSPAETLAEIRESQEETQAVSFPIDLNTAGKEEYMALPGIGDVLAERILNYRDTYGRFTNEEDLMKVEGIGEKRLEEILELITIGGSQ